MSRLLIEFVPNRDSCGALTLFDVNGRKICGSFAVSGRSTDALARAHGNAKRDPSLRYGDTPTGGYLVRQILKSGHGTQFEATQFGPHGVVVLEAISGDAAVAEANGRFYLLIEGGKRSTTGDLRSTAGSLRLDNKDLRKLIVVLRKHHDVRCDVIEREGRLKKGAVFDDASCVEEDPPPIPYGQQISRPTSSARLSGGDVRRANVGVAASAMVFGFAVSFVALQSSTPAHALTRGTSATSIPVSESKKLILPSSAPTQAFTRMAYNSPPQPGPATSAHEQSSWDGTWVGSWDGGNGTQIIIAGDAVTGFFWHGDYESVQKSSLSHEGASLTFTWQSGLVTLSRSRSTTAHAIIHENGRADVPIDLMRE